MNWVYQKLSEVKNSHQVFLTFRNKVVSFCEAYQFMCDFHKKLKSEGWKEGDAFILVAYPDHRVPLLVLALTAGGFNVLVTDPQSFVVKNVANQKVNFDAVIHISDNNQVSIDKNYEIRSEDRVGLIRGALLVLTSGTTGRPKLVVVSLEALLERAIVESMIFQIGKGDRILNVLGFAHELGLTQIFSTLLQIASLYIVPAVFTGQIIKEFEDIEPMGIVATPFFWEKLLSGNLNVKLSHLKWVSISGGMLSERDHHQIFQLLRPQRLVRTYGKTETGRSLYNDSQDFSIPHNLGFPVPRVSLELVKEAHCSNQAGNLAHYGGSLCESKNEDRLSLLGGHLTGDYFLYDTSKGFYFVGRKDRMVKRFDQRMYLDQIEYELSKVEGVRKAIVISDDKMNRLGTSGRIVAFIQMNEGKDNSGLRLSLAQHLRRPFLPDQIHFVTDWPQTPSLKIDFDVLARLAN